MPIPKSKVDAIEKVVTNFFPDAKISKQRVYPNGACNSVSFVTEAIVGSFMREVFNITTSFIIKPTRSLEVEMEFI